MQPLRLRRGLLGAQDEGIARMFVDMIVEGSMPEAAKSFTLGDQNFITICMTHKGSIGVQEDGGLVSIGVRFFGSRLPFQPPHLASMTWRRTSGGYTAMAHRTEASMMITQALAAIRCCGQAWINPEAPGTWTSIVANRGFTPMDMQPMPAQQGLLLREILTSTDQLGNIVESMGQQRDKQVALEEARARLSQRKAQLDRVGENTPSVLTERTYLDTCRDLSDVEQQLQDVAAQVDSLAEGAANLFATVIGNSIALSALKRAEAALALTGRRLKFNIDRKESAGE